MRLVRLECRREGGAGVRRRGDAGVGVAAPLGASVVGSMAKHVAKLVQPVVPAAKFPLVRIFGPRVSAHCGSTQAAVDNCLSIGGGAADQ